MKELGGFSVGKENSMRLFFTRLFGAKQIPFVSHLMKQMIETDRVPPPSKHRNKTFHPLADFTVGLFITDKRFFSNYTKQDITSQWKRAPNLLNCALCQGLDNETAIDLMVKFVEQGCNPKERLKAPAYNGLHDANQVNLAFALSSMKLDIFLYLIFCIVHTFQQVSILTYPFTAAYTAATAFHHMFSLPVVMWTHYIKQEIQEKLRQKQTPNGEKACKMAKLPKGFNDVMHPYIFSAIFKAQLRLLNMFGPWVDCNSSYGDSLKDDNAFLYYIFKLNTKELPDEGSSNLEAIKDLRKLFEMRCEERGGFQTNLPEIHLYLLSLVRCGLFSVDTLPIRQAKEGDPWDFVDNFNFKSKSLKSVGEATGENSSGEMVTETVKAFPQPDHLEILFSVDTDHVLKEALGASDEDIGDVLHNGGFPLRMTLDEVFCFVLFGKYVELSK